METTIYINTIPTIEIPKKSRNIAALPIFFLMLGRSGRKIKAGMVPNHMNTVVIMGVAPMLYDMKYESAALLMLMVVNAMTKKKERIRSGRLRTNSIHKVTHLDMRSIVCIHGNSFLAFKETEYKQCQPYKRKDAHGYEPSGCRFWGVVYGFHLAG